MSETVCCPECEAGIPGHSEPTEGLPYDSLTFCRRECIRLADRNGVHPDCFGCSNRLFGGFAAIGRRIPPYPEWTPHDYVFKKPPPWYKLSTEYRPPEGELDDAQYSLGL